MPQAVWTRFAPRLRKAIFGALDEARLRGSAEVTAEDLLLGIVRDPQSAASYILNYADAPLERVRSEVERELPRNGRNGHQLTLSTSARRALDLAEEESQKLRHNHIGTEHVLLGLIRGTSGPGGRILDRLGITYERAMKGLTAWRLAGMPRDVQVSASRRVRLPAVLRDWVERLAGSAARKIQLGYKVFVRKSIGHPGFAKNPYPLYRSLRRSAPVRRDPLLPVWIVTGYEQVQMVLRDPRFRRDPFTSDSLPDSIRNELARSSGALEPASAAELFAMQLLFLDPPRHTRLRSLFARTFTPRTVQQLRPRIEQIAADLLDRVIANGRMDVIRDLAYPLPTMVIAELLGFPAEDYEKLKRWSDDFAALLGLNPSGEQQVRAAASLAEMQEYFARIVARLRFQPADNLLSSLLSVEDDGDRLGDAELFANCVLLLAAGHETTTNLIGNGMLALLKNPAQLAALRDDPNLIDSAVEEFLRYDSPVQWTSRVAAETVELGGCRITQGDFVLASLGAANRDPNRFEHPDRLDIQRADNRHIAFGGGIHFCLGAALARLEVQIAISAMISKLANIRLAEKRLKWHSGVIFRGLHSLPVTFTGSHQRQSGS